MSSLWDCEKCGYNHYKPAPECKNCGTESNLPDMVNNPPHYKDTPRVVKILNEAVAIMAERGKSYDKSGGEAERSMPKIVAMFNALTGHTLTTEQGWDFMILLKLVRASQGYKHDNYIDGSAYFGLAGEAASEAVDD